MNIMNAHQTVSELTKVEHAVLYEDDLSFCVRDLFRRRGDIPKYERIIHVVSKKEAIEVGDSHPPGRRHAPCHCLG